MQIQHENITAEFFTSRCESQFFPGLSFPLFYFSPFDLLLRTEEKEEKVMAVLCTFPINLLLTLIKDQTRIQTQRYHKTTFAFHQFPYQGKLHLRLELNLWNTFSLFNFYFYMQFVCVKFLLLPTSIYKYFTYLSRLKTNKTQQTHT